jgi:hypothetical protein
MVRMRLSTTGLRNRRRRDGDHGRSVARFWKEMVVAYFMVFSRHLPKETEEDHGKLYSVWLVSKPD